MTETTIQTGMVARAADVKNSSEDERTVELSFSSEAPYERAFGIEILDHDPGSIRLDRLNARAPLLLDHDTRQQIGVVENVTLDGTQARAAVRFSKSEKGSEVFQDVVDGIRSNVSVGYHIHEMRQEDDDDDGKPVYRVTDWEPLEVSIVSVPADYSVGVGRENEPQIQTRIHAQKSNEENKMSEELKEVQAERAAVVAEQESLRAERERSDEILKVADKYNAMELARDYLNDSGKSASDLKDAILARNEKVAKQVEQRSEEPKPIDAKADVDLSEKEIRQYSVMRALRAQAFPDQQKFRNEAGFEYEVSEEAALVYGRESRGLIVPQNVLTRASDLLVGTNTAGGHTVSTDLLSGSFIDVLTNMMRVVEAGATVLTGLEGNVAIPRQTGRATTAWLAEDGTATASAQGFDQVTMSPKTVANRTQISRKMLLQSSIDIEAFVQRDLATGLALAMDSAAINGSGSSNQPTGIMNTSGIGNVDTATNGAALTYDDVVDLVTAVAEDNALTGSLKFLTNAKVIGQMLKTVIDSGSGKHITDDRGSLLGYELLESNQVPSNLSQGTGTNLSALLFGNFADLLIGQWSGVDLSVNPYSADDAGAVIVTAFMDVDIAVRHAESFANIDDIVA